MRFYCFTHFMLSSIQQGIQTAHCVHQAFVDNKGRSPSDDKLWDWARDHKTIVVLNGGNTADLNQLYLSIRRLCSILDLPYSAFNEDEQSLNGSITAVGCVIPEPIYTLASSLRENSIDACVAPSEYFSPEEVQLAELLTQYSLAR